jgi:hypothetical protein
LPNDRRIRAGVLNDVSQRLFDRSRENTVEAVKASA